MAKGRKVNVVNGLGKFTAANTLEVTAEDGSKTTITFDNAIIAAGSRPIELPLFRTKTHAFGILPMRWS